MRTRRHFFLTGMALLSLVGVLNTGCEQQSVLSRIQAQGELLVATRNSPTTYYEGPDGPAGLEYELVKRFADHLGVEARFVFPQPFSDLLASVRDGRVHMAAAGLTVTEERQRSLNFSEPYQEITQQLVYRRGSRRPRNLNDLVRINGTLEVMRGTSHEARLQTLKAQGHPKLSWVASDDYESEELLYLVEERAIDFTIADSNELAQSRRFLPHIKAAFSLTEPEPLAWAFAKTTDNSLLTAANAFLKKIRDDGTLKKLIAKQYRQNSNLNFVDRRTFWRHVEDRLPRYLTWFQQAADKNLFDWRLLAAVGYQESHWNPKAKSPTGVRGLMMLTLSTAKRVGVKNRLDPKQSIEGGARYLSLLEQSIPDRVPYPDRTWFALAGYNVGFGHLEDARVLTERQGGDPDRWAEVRQRLPLLSRKKYYTQLKHGYARGREPVIYVDNIRSYYDLLVWHTNTERRKAVRARAETSGIPDTDAAISQ